MSNGSSLSEWQAIVSQKMSHLSKPQVMVLAMWSYGMVMTQSCGLTTVTAFLASLLEQKENSVRQRLREWYKNGEDKQGLDRSEVEVTTCFAPLVMWVLSWWSTSEQRLALALDASSLGERFVVLAISIVYRSCAIPVAWVIVPAATPGEWRPHWETLFAHLRPSIPADWFVIVMADRGLYAPWLFAAIRVLDWHPFLRINLGGTFRAQGSSQFLPLASFLPANGQTRVLPGTCFKTNAIDCTLLVTCDDHHEHPWLIVTDLLPQQADIFWYAMRAWIECGFKQTKRAGWHWHNTKMTDPQRAARLWLAIAVATLWVVSVGGDAEAHLPASSFEALPLSPAKRSQPRLLSCFRRGIVTILAALLNRKPFPLGRFLPLPWPTSPVASALDIPKPFCQFLTLKNTYP